MRLATLTFALAGLLAGPLSPAAAWHGKGHELATAQAVAALPAEMPPFFRGGGADITGYCLEPDLFTRPIAPEELHAAESPEHFFDTEPLGQAEIPARRYDLLAWCYKNGLPPAKVGLAPYALTEWTQRLTVALAEHRKWPNDTAIQKKCLLYAGFLAHYAEDVCQPLHTTIHYDGRAKEDGSSPRSGIHNKVDALLGKLPEGAKAKLDPKEITPFETVFPAAVAQIKASHALVDQVYQLEKDLPAYEEPMKMDTPVSKFAQDRLNVAALFTARLYVTAWRDSSGIKLPDWHQRTQPPAASQPATAPAAPPSFPRRAGNASKLPTAYARPAPLCLALSPLAG